MAKSVKVPTPKKPIQNNVGSPIPGGRLIDERKSGMSIRVLKLPNPASGRTGGVGSGSGKLGGGSLGGAASPRKKY